MGMYVGMNEISRNLTKANASNKRMYEVCSMEEGAAFEHAERNDVGVEVLPDHGERKFPREGRQFFAIHGPAKLLRHETSQSHDLIPGYVNKWRRMIGRGW